MSVENEDIGGRAAEALLSVGLPAQLRARVIRAMWDEIRHSELFLSYADGVGTPARDLAPAQRLCDTLDLAETEVEFALLHTELEASALDVFRLIRDGLAGTRIGNIYAAVTIDETSHVSLGNDIVTTLLRRGAGVDPERAIHVLTQSTRQLPHTDPEALEVFSRAIGGQPPAVARFLSSRHEARVKRIWRQITR